MAEADVRKSVFVEGLEVFAHHGFTTEEQQLGHRFRFDVEVQVGPTSDWMSDAIEETVDYGEIIAIVQEVAIGERIRLVETLAARILDLIEERLPAVIHAKVRVAKLQPPVPGVVAAAGVTLERAFHQGA